MLLNMAKVAERQHNFSWSDLGRRSTDVGDALDEFGEVTVIRGGEVLRLAPAAAPSIIEVTRILSAVLSKLVELGDTPTLTKVLAAAWPWTRPLPTDDQLLLAREVAGAVEICEDLDTWAPLAQVLADWRRTARAWAEGMRPIGPVAQPDGSVLSRPR